MRITANRPYVLTTIVAPVLMAAVVILISWGIGKASTASVTGFPDVAPDRPDATAIVHMQQLGIINGYPDGTFGPDNTIKRAELAKIVVRALVDSKTINECLTLNGDPFPDTPSDEWFTENVCMAKQANLIAGYPDGTFQPGTRSLRQKLPKFSRSPSMFPCRTRGRVNPGIWGTSMRCISSMPTLQRSGVLRSR